MARIHRDAHGVPHVRAASILDLAHAQGRVTALDRTWQLEWLLRRATGTTAEVFGEPALGWDRFARRTMLVDTARRAHEVLTPASRAFVAAYVVGLNAGLSELPPGSIPELVELDIEAQPWEDWTPLAVFHAQHVLFAGLGGALWKRRAEAVLGDDARLLSHEGPVASGSNAWAVGGDRTASGLPLIGGDPHRIIEQPGVYQQVRLACTDPEDPFDVVGFAFTGVPGVQHFAHAGDVAWAITNAMADYQDVHPEAVPACDVVEQRTETIAVRGAAAETVEVVRTERGVVFEDGWSLRDAATVLGDLGFEALLPLLRARTVDDVDRALDRWVEPVNNVIAADVHGTVRYRVAGRVPVREDRTGEWTGWLDPLPRTEIPPDGQVVSANERRGPESDAVGRQFAPPHRAERLHALLDGRTDLAPADFVAFHNDTLLLTVPILTSLVPGAFDDFDGRMEADSEPAARFAAWRSALVRRIAAAPVFAPLHDPAPEHRHQALFAPWLDVTARIALALPTLVAAGTPFGLDLAALARLALEDVDDASSAAGSGASAATWGDMHVATPVHAFEVMGLEPPALPHLAVSGDSECVRCTGSLPGITDDCYRGSVARYVWDLSDRRAGGWVVPTGAASHPDDAHHHDQLPLWVAGDLAPIVTEWDLLTTGPMTDAGVRHLRLERLDPARDAALIHSWVTEERARFWMMGDHTLEEVRAIYEWIDAQPTHAAWLAMADDEPAALFQTYEPRAEEVGDHFDVGIGDVGVHFMIAPPTREQAGFTGTLIPFLIDATFADPSVLRVMAEPDARNDKAVALLQRIGFELGPVVELSTKPAQLAFLTREAFERMPRDTTG